MVTVLGTPDPDPSRRIQASTVTAATIVANAGTVESIRANSITAADIAANAVSYGRIGGDR